MKTFHPLGINLVALAKKVSSSHKLLLFEFSNAKISISLFEKAFSNLKIKFDFCARETFESSSFFFGKCSRRKFPFERIFTVVYPEFKFSKLPYQTSKWRNSPPILTFFHVPSTLQRPHSIHIHCEDICIMLPFIS